MRRLRLPPALQGVFFDLLWDKHLVWQLPTPPTTLPLADLVWHLDLPVWSTAPPRPLFDLAPATVLAQPHTYADHWRRTLEAPLHLPLEMFENGGRWVVLDGYHRLARHHLRRTSLVPVRLHPGEHLQRIALQTE